MATPFSYTMPNWREGQPSAAEAGLLQEAGAHPADGSAFLLAQGLAAQRQSNAVDYAHELAQSHAFSQQALAQHTQAQNREDLIKYISEVGLKNPGALGLMYGNPTLSSMNPGGFNDEMAQQFTDYTTQDVNTQAAERMGKAAEAFRAGGYQIPVQDLTDTLSKTPLRFADVLPTNVQASWARGLVDAQPHWSRQFPPDTAAGGVQTTVGGKGQPPPTAPMIDDQRAGRPVVIPTPQSPVSNLLPPGTSVTGPAAYSMNPRARGPTPTAPQPNTFNPNAPPPGTSSAPPASASAQSQQVVPAQPSPTRTAATKAGEQWADRLKVTNPDDYRSIVARAMREGGGQIVVGQVPGGDWFILGENGLKVPIPNMSTSRGTMP